MIDDLLVVIVLYKITLKESLSFKTLLDSVSSAQKISLYVYDNSPSKSADKLLYNNVSVKYVHDQNNGGISKAYNSAAKYAALQGKKWLLLLDQDSSLPVGFLDKIQNDIVKFPNENLFVPVLQQNNLILSPCKFRFMKGSALNKINAGIFPLEGHSVFNSGIIIKLSEFSKVGGYDENIPLDFSDHCFIHRFKKHNKNVVVMPVSIEHELSSHSNDKGVIFRRFNQYCFGVKRYAETEGGGGWLFFWTLLRAIKLTLKFRDLAFLEVFFKTKREL